ncbi:T9SS type A sorting domain-containing protein [Taibaiella koreensis]|uniref:T9SS type A sorting domain-containing protein n=1 Tax=Taibaiella koreensis TaxID=1268548 RepID=UPI000E59BCD1|nr:T9SS type A sorting domain-containing protein [Taibaiella koreensis]
MNKIYLAAALACIITGTANAQISEGGIPWSIQSIKEGTMTSEVAAIKLATPDYETYKAQDLQDAVSGAAKPYRVAALINTDIDLNSGRWSYRADGSKVWRASVHVEKAQGLDFYYDKFSLPKGVRLYLANENGRQILGAYTHSNNNRFGNFTNEPVQGSTAYLELDVDAGVTVSDIGLHINGISAYYRGADDLFRFAGDGQLPVARPTAGSSPCNVNANCPQADRYGRQNKATVKVTIPGKGVCSGTMMNNTGNVKDGTCKPLMLTATHCDSPTHRDDANYSLWRFETHYQSVACDGTVANDPLKRTLTGASFRARSNNPSFPIPAHSLVADFILLELADPIPASYDVYLAGWNRNTNIANLPEYDFFIGFHHPHGDFKKLVTADGVLAGGQFNQTSVPATHWNITAAAGGTEEGSSGSGLFDKDGRLVGDLSGGPDGTSDCAPLGFNALYSKISYAWDNVYDQTAFPAFAGPQSQLKTWLDPLNGGATMILDATKSDCSDFSPVGIKELEQLLNSSVSLYPNPVTTGFVRVKTNFTKLTDLNVTVFNILGAKMGTFALKNVGSNEFALDMTGYANGTYLVNIATGDASIAKKIVLNR